MLPESTTCSTTEAASQLGVSVPTVIKWVRDGTLQGHQRQVGRRSWRIEAASIRDALDDRGGPGAHRGRPSGSVTAVSSEVASLARRVQSLEQAVDGLDSTTATVLAGLVQLLHADGSERRAQSEEITRAATKLEELLAGSRVPQDGARGPRE